MVPDSPGAPWALVALLAPVKGEGLFVQSLSPLLPRTLGALPEWTPFPAFPLQVGSGETQRCGRR